jgi:hypothetical protein
LKIKIATSPAAAPAAGGLAMTPGDFFNTPEGGWPAEAGATGQRLSLPEVCFLSIRAPVTMNFLFESPSMNVIGADRTTTRLCLRQR